MFVKLHLPTMIDGHIQSGAVVALSDATATRLIKAGVAKPDPELDTLKEKARKLGQNVDWAEQERFKNMRVGVVASITAEETFGEKLRRAVEKLPSSPKQTKERAERERSRYRKPERRQPTKGD